MRKLLALVLLLAGCASTQRRDVRVLVYNIHAGKDAKGVDNLERVAALVRETRADVVLLQEVDRGTTRSGNVDQLDTLMRLTGYHGVFGKSLDYQGGDYGIAALSRWPIAPHETVHLPVEPPQTRAGGSIEPRVALVIQTAAMTIVNTHLDASREDTYRAQEAAHLIELLRVRRGALLVGGDFNSTPDSAVQASLRASGLRDSWAECGSGPDLTYPADVPVKRIDYLFLTGDDRCTKARVLDSSASDHRPVVVDVKVRAR